MNEATVRMKINKLLEAAGWRFFAEGDKPANICLEPGVTIKQSDFDAFGDNFEKKIQAAMGRVGGEKTEVSRVES